MSSTAPLFSGVPRVINQVEVGQDVSLECSATGYPKPNITIKKADGEDRLAKAGGQLIILRAKPEDNGQYICIASNGLGTIRYVFNLQVRGKGIIFFYPCALLDPLLVYDAPAPCLHHAICFSLKPSKYNHHKAWGDLVQLQRNIIRSRSIVVFIALQRFNRKNMSTDGWYFPKPPPISTIGALRKLMRRPRKSGQQANFCSIDVMGRVNLLGLQSF